MDEVGEPSLGERFARAMAAKDPEAMRAVLHPEVDFRGMTPGTFWEASDAVTVIEEILPRWFEDHDYIDDVVWLEDGHVSDRQRVGYRLAVHNGDGRFLIEQQAFYDVKDNAITWIRVLCSGWRPAE